VLNVKTGPILLPRPFARNARSRVCGEQEDSQSYPQIQGITCQERREEKNKDAAKPFFHRLRPLTSITESDAQVSGGETRQDYKDTRRFPLAAPSCALLFLPFGLPVSFRCYGRVYLIPRLTLSSGKAVRSKLDCMHEPPFSPTAASVPVTINLSPSRRDTPKRHWQQPLVTDLEELVLKLCTG
jgi:hypothetical protein